MHTYVWQACFFSNALDLLFQCGFCKIEDPVVFSDSSKFGDIFNYK